MPGEGQRRRAYTTSAGAGRGASGWCPSWQGVRCGGGRATSASTEERWAAFEATTGLIRLSDVPFPIKAALVVEVQRQGSYKQLALRWHPDKFCQNYGARLHDKEKDAIMDRVKETFQVINGARKG